MTSPTGVSHGRSFATARIAMSRSVIMPTRRSSSPTGRTPASHSAIMRAASAIVWSGRATTTSVVIASLTFMAAPLRFQGVGRLRMADVAEPLEWVQREGAMSTTVFDKKGKRVRLAEISAEPPKGMTRAKAEERFKELGKELFDLQDRLWGAKTRSVMVVLQGRDSAGKDGAIKDRKSTRLNSSHGYIS